ncbi:MAG: pyroglutamyl-peptidase I [Deltaproteobacteria bacterium]|nr:pyroglutamyl-peptidase I [Deltaproteobacteria bacterium]
MRIVLSGFEPFGGRAVNRSATAAERLAERWPGELELVTLPVRFATLPEAIERVAVTTPDFWLMLGEASSASGLRLESTAANEISARIPDNDGAQPQGHPIAPGGKVLQTALSIDALVRELTKLEVPVERSDDAGRFACNAAYYLALAKLGANRVLFVHVPDDATKLSGEQVLRGLFGVLEFVFPRAPAST